ncbi:hypothetical protein [Croceimicrobium sp.]|uniref:hypothetical protein n=1 Tax=Croceimicrobium sp. TaxID=2828340 RepID=UPI003BACC917
MKNRLWLTIAFILAILHVGAQDFWSIENEGDLDKASSLSDTLYLEFIGYTPNLDSIADKYRNRVFGLRLYNLELHSTKVLALFPNINELTIYSGHIDVFDFKDLPDGLKVFNISFRPRRLLNSQILVAGNIELYHVGLTGRKWSKDDLFDILKKKSINSVYLKQVDLRDLDVELISPNIEVLTLIDCKLSDLVNYNFNTQGKMRELNVYNCKLKSIESLSKMESLTSVTFVDCKLKSPDFITELSNLKYASLRYNKFNGVFVLNNPSIEFLDLSHNNIRVFGKKRSAKELKLDVSYNKLDSVFGLESGLKVFYHLGNTSPIKGLSAIGFNDICCMSYSCEMMRNRIVPKTAKLIFYDCDEALEFLEDKIDSEQVLLPSFVTYGSRRLLNCEDYSMPSIMTL